MKQVETQMRSKKVYDAIVSIYKNSQIDTTMWQMELEIIIKILKLLSLSGYWIFVCFIPQSIFSPFSWKYQPSIVMFFHFWCLNNKAVKMSFSFLRRSTDFFPLKNTVWILIHNIVFLLSLKEGESSKRNSKNH